MSQLPESVTSPVKDTISPSSAVISDPASASGATLKYPGLHLRRLSRELNIPKTTMEYNLRYLEKQGLIVIKSEGKYHHFYVAKRVGNIDKKVLSTLQKDIARKIILFLFLYPRTSRVDISKELEKPATTIGYHLKKLHNIDIVERDRYKHKIIYKIKKQKEMYKLLITYEKSFFDDTTVRLLLKWVRYVFPDGMPKRDNTKASDLEDISKAFYDIFPHPYHV